MIVNCPVCGKMYDVLWPNMWSYKRNNRYLCSWKCLREYDRKEAEPVEAMKRDRSRLTDEIINEIEAGRNPIEFLKGLGYGNPSQAYSDIRKKMKKQMPEKFAKLPEDLRAWNRQHGNTPLPKKQKPERIETPEENAGLIIPKQKPKTPVIEYRTTAVKIDSVGEFYHDEKYGCIDWRTPGGDEISLPVADWISLPEMLKFVFKALGV